MVDILTSGELAELAAEVQKEIDKENKEKERARLKKEMLSKARQERGLEEAYEEIFIDLPESGSKILVNSYPYAYGRMYTVPASVAIMLRDTMQRAWSHQAEIEGRSKDFYRKRNTMMSAVTGAVRNSPGGPGGVLRA
jgi:hypothetical protein